MDELVGWKREERTLHGVTRAVYYKRNRGPGVILMHEIPGITPEVLRLGALVADSGFTVALPTFFGTPGKPSTWAYTTLQTLRMCISWEFNVFAANDSSPVVDWIRALCQDLHAEVGGSRGIGAIGLCITGNFALALTVGVGGIVQAPILGEPALPFPKPFINNAGAVHLSPTEEAEIRQNTTPALGLRFTADYRCKAERFASYRRLLGPERFRFDEIKSPDQTFGISSDAHSVLTTELRTENPAHPTALALRSTIQFLRSRLLPYP